MNKSTFGVALKVVLQLRVILSAVSVYAMLFQMEPSSAKWQGDRKMGNASHLLATVSEHYANILYERAETPYGSL
jgi:hypothetical protein